MYAGNNEDYLVNTSSRTSGPYYIYTLKNDDIESNFGFIVQNF